MADLTVNLLALATGRGEALLLADHIRDGEGLVPALLPRLVPALLTGLVPALALRIADLLGDSGALLLKHGRADLLSCCAALTSHCSKTDLLEGGAALAPRLRASGRHLHGLAVRRRLVPALVLPDSLADRGEDLEPGQGGLGSQIQAQQSRDLKAEKH